MLDALDREFTPDKLAALTSQYTLMFETYAYRNNKGNYVLCWDHARFVNHSFKANCLSTAYDFEIAIRDIRPGEQLTDDYGYLNIDTPFRGIDEGTRRKKVYPDDLKNYYQVWDKKIAAVFPKLNEVEQPLRSLLSKAMEKEIEAVLQGKKQLASILENYFPREK